VKKVQQDLNRSWLEPVLAEHLKPVAAPRELLARVKSQRQSSPRALRAGLVALAAVLVIGVAIGLLRDSRPKEFRSSNAQEVQAWVKANTGLDVPFRGRFGESVKLIGASRIDTGVEIAFTLQDRTQKLQISKLPAGGPKAHKFVGRGAQSVSWTMGGQAYTLKCATPQDAQAACALCHAGGAVL
jgi:hypothetical protein